MVEESKRRIFFFNSDNIYAFKGNKFWNKMKSWSSFCNFCFIAEETTELDVLLKNHTVLW